MKHLAVIAIAPILGIGSLLMCDSYGLVPADSNTRRTYAASLEQDFIAKRVRDTVISTTGAENRTLMLDAPWIDGATAAALVNEGVARKAARYGFNSVIFQNGGFRVNYDIRTHAYNQEPVLGSASK